MRAPDIDSVNHVGLVVADIHAAARRFEAMGFVLSPLSMHKGATEPGKPAEPFGSGNRCAVFAKNYLEIVAHVEKDKRDVFVGKYLARFEGTHIICFNSPALEACDARLKRAGIATSGPIPLQRDVDTPDGPRTAKFSCTHFADAGTPEGLIQAAYHRTPQYIHQPRHIVHPNGCTALSNVYIAADDVQAVEARYKTYTDVHSDSGGSKTIFRLPLVSRVTILHADEVQKVLPGALQQKAPFMPGFGFATTNIMGMAARLDAAGIPHAHADGKIVVPASHGFGAAIAFEPV
jgi:hypothetical protein